MMRRRLSLLEAVLLAVLLAMMAATAWGEAAVTGDILFVRKAPGTADVPPAIFNHWKHRVQFKCYACHNDKVGFEMKAGATPITMDAMEEEKYCGACHKGKPAFKVNFETCIRCHRK